MAVNITGHITTSKQSDTVLEHLARASCVGNSRFQTLRNVASDWIGCRGSIGSYGLYMRLFLVRKIKAA